MFRGWFRTAVLAIVPCFWAGLATAAAPTPEPYMLVRSLRMLQDQVAAGKPEALPMLNRVLGHIASNFRNADPKAWEKPANAYASIVYLLNGGNPDVVRNILRLEGLASIDPALVEGALAYADGNSAGVVKNFSGKMPDEIPGELVASIYLVTAAQLSAVDRPTAAKRLDQVRLAVPGTLLEEAAIRRSLMIAARLGDAAKVKTVARNYLQRFTYSPYSEDFYRQFVDALILLNDKISNDDISELSRYARSRARLPFYLRLARGAVVTGQLDKARYAAEQAGNLAERLKIDSTQARLYLAISNVGSTKTSDAMQALTAIPRSRLHERDIKLLDAALGIAGQIVKQPAIAVPKPALMEPVATDEPVEIDMDDDMTMTQSAALPDLVPPAMAIPETADPKATEPSDKALIGSARDRLAEIDDLLEGKRR